MKVNLASGGRDPALMRRVVEIDPSFAMAYANLALTYSGLGESVLAAESATKAWQLRERASERERFFIDLQLRSRGHGESGTRVPDARTLGADLPSSFGTSGRDGALGGPLYQGHWTVGDSRRSRAKDDRRLSGRSHRIWQSGSLEFLPRPVRRGRERPPAGRRVQERVAGTAAVPGLPIQHRVHEGRRRRDGSSRRSGQRQAPRRTLGGELTGPCSSSFRPRAIGPATIQPGRGSGSSGGTA